jgi:CelD/BcsL family acetyltransferase involved in cellulose biosynthesis
MNMARFDIGLAGAGDGAVCLSTRELRQVEPAWRRLSRNAAEENAYYAPDYARPLLDNVEGRRVAALAVHEGRELVALLPFVRRRWSLLKEPVNVAWQTKFTFSSHPLLDKHRPKAAAASLVEAMSGGTSPGALWAIPNIAVDGPVSTALRAALDRKGMAYEILGGFERAVLDRTGSFADHMARYVSSKRRRELARNRRRLAELGALTYSNCTGGAALDEIVQEFLRIERSGWKGSRGTALASRADTLAFALAALRSRSQSPFVRGDMLSLDGKALAVGLTIQVGRVGFTIKCAYDETYRNYAPGLLLEEDVIRDFLSNDWADRLDSGTYSGHVIESLWSGTMRVADLVICADAAHGKGRLKDFITAEHRLRGMAQSAKKAGRRLLGAKTSFLRAANEVTARLAAPVGLASVRVGGLLEGRGSFLW